MYGQVKRSTTSYMVKHFIKILQDLSWKVSKLYFMIFTRNCFYKNVPKSCIQLLIFSFCSPINCDNVISYLSLTSLTFKVKRIFKVNFMQVACHLTCKLHLSLFIIKNHPISFLKAINVFFRENNLLVKVKLD